MLRVLVCLIVLVMGGFMNSSCSKRGSIEDQIEMIRNFGPAPMPPDSLEVDSLKKTGFR